MVPNSSQFNKPEPNVFGSGSEKKKEEIRQKILSNFREGHAEQISEEGRRKLEQYERKKQPFESEAITHADDITNEILQDVGLEGFRVPEQNIHLVEGEYYERHATNPDTVATTLPENGAIVLNMETFEGRPIEEVTTILHEMLHLKGHFSINVREEVVQGHRSGLTVYSHDESGGPDNPPAFTGINEAVVTRLEKAHFRDLLGRIDALQEQQEWLESDEAQELIEKICSHTEYNPDEIIWIDEDQQFSRFSYYEQRKVLNLITEEVYKNNQDEFERPEEVFDEFVRAHFTGRLLDLARYVEEVFGEGAFRRISEMTTDPSSAKELYDDLKDRIANG